MTLAWPKLGPSSLVRSLHLFPTEWAWKQVHPPRTWTLPTHMMRSCSRRHLRYPRQIYRYVHPILCLICGRIQSVFQTGWLQCRHSSWVYWGADIHTTHGTSPIQLCHPPPRSRVLPNGSITRKKHRWAPQTMVENCQRNSHNCSRCRDCGHCHRRSCCRHDLEE